MFIEADTHCHTVASSHAYSTVMELAQSAKEAGLKAVAVTDHSIGGPDSPHIWYFHNFKNAIPREINGITIIFGSEVNIMRLDGTLDMDECELKKLEWIVASMHGTIMEDGNFDDYTECYLKVAENPYIDVIGHCATPKFKFDYEKVIPVFKKNNKLVELNESALANKKGFKENYIEILNICKKHEVPIVVNTDAHFCLSVGKTPLSQKLLSELDFPEELIVNKSFEKIKAHIISKRGNIFE